MKSRKLLKITSRTSSITNSFVQAIIPTIPAVSGDYENALSILGMTREKISCVYCGAVATDWDHLRPLVRNKKPTGYFDEIRNRVPSCAPCNQSKSGQDWRTWVRGDARGSPKTKGVSDLSARCDRLEQFEKWGALAPQSLQELTTQEDWNQHWANLDAIQDKMKEAQRHADKLRAAIADGIKARNPTPPPEG